MNASEWVNDWYAEDFYRSSPSRDPQGPARGGFKVLRGVNPATVRSSCGPAIGGGTI